MFAKPRPKKNLLPPPSKKRKIVHSIAEISFDNDARQEYLTGFHKRKQQRIKRAQEEAATRAREEKLETRKQIREERRREIEEHVEKVNSLLRDSATLVTDVEDTREKNESAEEWGGLPERPDLELVDHKEEYVDEDRYTTVTIESVAVSRDGLKRPELPEDNSGEDSKGNNNSDGDKATKPATTTRAPKKKKLKFRYESKLERRLTERKQKAKKRSHRQTE